MFTMEGKTPGFFDDLRKEVLEMCSSFGVIEKLFIEKNNQGNIWVKFNDTPAAFKAQETLSTQYFDGKKVFCYFVTDQTYQSRVGN
jgi:RNA-binding protein 39